MTIAARTSPRASLLVLLGLAALTSGGCRMEKYPPTPEDAAVRRAIAQRDSLFDAAVRRRNVKIALRAYESDIQVPAARRTPRTVPGFRRAAFADVMDLHPLSIRLSASDVELMGDVAVETGRYAALLRLDTGAVVPDSGDYLAVWRRQTDGPWKLHRDSFDSDLPPKN